MPQQEQEISERINKTGQILATSHLIGFDKQPLLVVQANGLFIQHTSNFLISSDFIIKKLVFLVVVMIFR
jgi:hypothetical protein